MTEDPLTIRGRTIWSSADFLPIARSYEAGAAEFITRLELRAAEAVLDVACGTGNLAIPAALAGARVTGVDIAPNLIDEAKEEARKKGVSVAFEVGDAEALPYESGKFDSTVTMFGAMFAPRPDRAAEEMLRVTKRGGRIAMANWVPNSFVGQMLKAHVAVVPPPVGVPSPLLWGNEGTVRERFGDRVRGLTCTPRKIELRFAMKPAEVTELFATYYGPTVATLRAASPEGQRQLRDSLTRLWEEHNLAQGNGTAVASDYLDVRAQVA